MILLTGASGFVGRHLQAALTRVYGHDQVTALTSAPIPGGKYLLSNGYRFEKDFFQQAGLSDIRAVIHAGAYTPKSGPEADDWMQCNANIINTDHLLRALPATTGRFILLSTLDVYGQDDYISESTPIQPISLYGQSKVYCERMVACWGKAAGSVIQNLRIGHVYGPGEEKYRKIIPEAFRRILAGQGPQIWGTGVAIRSFIYIEDVVALILKALDLDQYEGPVNLAGSHPVTIRKLVDTISEITGNDKPVEYLPTSVATRDLTFDTARMKRLLGSEQTSLTEGLRQEWAHMKSIHTNESSL